MTTAVSATGSRNDRVFVMDEDFNSNQDIYRRIQKLIPIISPEQLKRNCPVSYDKLRYSIVHYLDKYLPKWYKAHSMTDCPFQ
jgi:hypothetical protein